MDHINDMTFVQVWSWQHLQVQATPSATQREEAILIDASDLKSEPKLNSITTFFRKLSSCLSDLSKCSFLFIPCNLTYILCLNASLLMSMHFDFLLSPQALNPDYYWKQTSWKSSSTSDSSDCHAVTDMI